MTAHPFSVEAFPGRLHVTGEIDLAVAPALRDAILSAGLSGEASELVVDLSAVRYLDSSGIAALLEAHRQLAAVEVVLRVERPNVLVGRVLELTRVGEVLGLPAFAPAD